jgi:hypothetical protein
MTESQNPSFECGLTERLMHGQLYDERNGREYPAGVSGLPANRMRSALNRPEERKGKVSILNTMPIHGI